MCYACRVTLFQALMLHGMKKTTPAIASAMPNLAPGFIFVVAGCLRYPCPLINFVSRAESVTIHA